MRWSAARLAKKATSLAAAGVTRRRASATLGEKHAFAGGSYEGGRKKQSGTLP